MHNLKAPFSFIELFRQIEEQRLATKPMPLYTVGESYHLDGCTQAEKDAFYAAYNEAIEEPDTCKQDALMAPFSHLVGDSYDLAEGIQLSTSDLKGHALDVVSQIDAYGSGYYRIKKQHLTGQPDEAKQVFFLLETYGDEDSSRHDKHMLIYTPCILLMNNKGQIIGGEVADLVLTLDNKVEIRNHYQLPEKLPLWLSKAFDSPNIGGKRALYFSPEQNRISVRCSPEIYVKAKKYQDPDRPVGNPNLSGTRLLFPATPVVR